MIDIYTDGSCSLTYDKSPGGWSCIITNGTKVKVLSGGELYTTNNRMEIMAVIKALEFCESKVNQKIGNVRILTDSAYVVNAINQRWIKKWINNGWITSKNTPVDNKDLWEIINEYDKKINFQIIKVKGHSKPKGNEINYNDLADKEAKKQMNKMKNL